MRVHCDAAHVCRAEGMFRKAAEIEEQDVTYQQLGRVLLMQEDMSGALAVYHQALDRTPDSADTLCQIGLLHLRQGGLLAHILHAKCF